MSVDPQKIFKAANYIDAGIPLKDILSDREVEEAICMLADVFLVTGTPLLSEEEDGNS